MAGHLHVLLRHRPRSISRQRRWGATPSEARPSRPAEVADGARQFGEQGGRGEWRRGQEQNVSALLPQSAHLGDDEREALVARHEVVARCVSAPIVVIGLIAVVGEGQNRDCPAGAAERHSRGPAIPLSDCGVGAPGRSAGAGEIRRHDNYRASQTDVAGERDAEDSARRTADSGDVLALGQENAGRDVPVSTCAPRRRREVAICGTEPLATSLLPTELGRRSAATSPPAGFPPPAGWVSFAMSSVKTVFAPPSAMAVPGERDKERDRRSDVGEGQMAADAAHGSSLGWTAVATLYRAGTGV